MNILAAPLGYADDLLTKTDGHLFASYVYWKALIDGPLRERGWVDDFEAVSKELERRGYSTRVLRCPSDFLLQVSFWKVKSKL